MKEFREVINLMALIPMAVCTGFLIACGTFVIRTIEIGENIYETHGEKWFFEVLE